MERRAPAFVQPKPQKTATPMFTETHLPPGQPAPPPPAGLASLVRPLSDIRELSEPSLIDGRTGDNNTTTTAPTAHPSLSRAPSLRNQPSVKRSESSRAASRPPPSQQPRSQLHTRSLSAAPTTSSSSAYSTTPDRSSLYSIPHSNIPRRSSSHTHAHKRGPTRKTSGRTKIPPPPRPVFEGLEIPNRGPGRSPVKDASSRYDAIRSDANRRVPSRTHVRAAPSTEILAFPTYRHPRVKVDLQVSAPLFVGGGGIEGTVKLTIDESERLRSTAGSRRSLALGGISVDLIGFEDVDTGARKASFLAVGTELIDTRHPPPANMLEPPNPLASATETFWPLAPSTSTLPFMLSLPLDTGPPPFQSKYTRIRFLLAATVRVRDAGKLYDVRTSQDIHVIPTYDPEKALTSLPSPLTATDELMLRHFGRAETVVLTAGLHRQVWVCGGSIFVDVHIANRSHKAVRKVEASLERDVLVYRHAPAATGEKSVSQARIFERREQTVIARTSTKAGASETGWPGLEPHSSEIRTWELEIPRGHATVRCGKFFEVRFFINVCVTLTGSTGKAVAVQLPVTLIHINSLDVVPNCVAQVARAIEEKRAKKNPEERVTARSRSGHRRQWSASSLSGTGEPKGQPSYSQGRAFAAPRQQSIDRQRAARREIEALGRAVDSSPRKFEAGKGGGLRSAVVKRVESNSNFYSVDVRGGEELRHERQGDPFSVLAFSTPPQRKRSRDDRLRVRKGRDHPLPPPPLPPPPPPLLSSRPTYSNHPTGHHKEQRQPKTKPSYNFTVLPNISLHHLHPQALGLSSDASSPSLGPQVSDTQRPATGLGFRERIERSRFEVKGVRRRGSGRSVREKAEGWWQGMKGLGRGRGKDCGEKEGWI